MHEQGMSYFELLVLQAYLGIPVLIASVTFLIWYLKRTTYQSLVSLGFSSICLTLSSLFIGITIWRFWPFENLDIMVLEFINLPTFIACLVSVPICIWLFSLKQKNIIASF